MSQVVTVPGVGDLEFPDGMSQPDMAAAIQRNFPQIHPRIPPGRIPTGVPSVDLAPEPAPRPQPTAMDRVVGGIQGAIDVGQRFIEGMGGMFGSAGGALGGALAAAQVKLSGGVQPDSDAVRAVTGPGKPGAPDALDEAAQQGAQNTIGAMRTAGGIVNQVNPLAPALGAIQSAATPQSQGVAEGVAEGALAPGGLVSNLDPGMVPPALRGEAAPVGRGMAQAGGKVAQVADKALTPVDAAVGAVSHPVQAATNAAAAVGAISHPVQAATNAAAAVIPKVLGKADPELAALADKASSLPHPIQISPDSIAAPGSTAQSAAQTLRDLPLSGGKQRELANIDAMTKNTADIMIPGTDKSRINGSFIRESMDHNGAIIGDGYTAAGPIPLAEIEGSLQGVLTRAAESGHEAPALNLIAARVRQLTSKADAAGNIDPTTIREWETSIGKDIRAPGMLDEVSGMLADLQNTTRDAIMDRLPPEQAQAVTDARRRYAYTLAFSRQVAKRGKPGSAITLNGQVVPGKLIDVATSTHTGQTLLGRGAGGPLEDLARIGQVIDTRTKDAAPGFLRRTTEATLGAVTGYTAGRVYNKAAGRATERMLADRRQPPPEPPAPPPELELAPPGEPLGPGGGGAPAAPGPLGDLTPDWETAPGAGAPPNGAASVDAAGLHPALGEPAVTTGRATTPAMGAPGSQIPAVPGRPDLPDTMVVGAPAEAAGSDTANAAMHEPGAVEARRVQTQSELSKKANELRTVAEEEAAKPKPNAAEQARLSEIDAQIAQTKSDIVRETLTTARAKIEKEVAARDAAEKAKSAADELRTAAMTMTDPATRAALIERADKLDPPPKIPAGETKEGQPTIPGGAPTKPLPRGEVKEGQPSLPTSSAKPKALPPERVSYLDDPAWRKLHGLNDEDAQAALRMREAFDHDPEAVARAAAKYDTNPKALDAEIAKILEKRDANQGNGAAGGSQGASSEAGQPGGNVAAGRAEPGPNGATAPGSNDTANPAGGPAPEKAVTEAADRAQFEAAHPRGADGQFVERNEPRNLMSEWRAVRKKFMDAVSAGKDYEASVHSKHMNDLAMEIRKTEEKP